MATGYHVGRGLAGFPRNYEFIFQRKNSTRTKMFQISQRIVAWNLIVVLNKFSNHFLFKFNLTGKNVHTFCKKKTVLEMKVIKKKALYMHDYCCYIGFSSHRIKSNSSNLQLSSRPRPFCVLKNHKNVLSLLNLYKTSHTNKYKVRILLMSMKC